jgi:hypothetical protein
MNSGTVSVTVRVAPLTFILLCMITFVLQREHGENTLLRRFQTFFHQESSTAESHAETLNSNPFQLRLNSKYVLSRYLRHQPEYGPFHNALAVVFQETPRDEPLLLTLDASKKTLRFHSLVATTKSDAQQLWVISNGNYAVGVGEAPDGASQSEFEINEEGHLTFNGEEKWGYCHITETRAIALYWFGDENVPIPKGCVSDVILTRADYDFPAIDEPEETPMKRRVKRRFDNLLQGGEIMA